MAKPNNKMEAASSVQKKDKMADRTPRRLCVSHSSSMGPIFAEIRLSGEQIWKSIWNEHKIIAWSY